MSMITGMATAYAQAAAQYQKQQKTSDTEKKEKTDENGKAVKKNEVKGAASYGNPRLSDEGLEYYNSLKKKFGNIKFVLVSSDKKAEAEAIKGSFATPGRMTVLIDEDKIEKMATDRQYREKIEATIANASTGVSDLKKQLEASGVKANAFGITVDDGGNAQYFAVLKKANDLQRERIEKKAEQKRTEKKESEKKAEKKKIREKAEEESVDEDTVTVSAGSVEELIKKIQDYSQEMLTDSVRTDEENQVGQSFDYSV